MGKRVHKKPTGSIGPTHLSREGVDYQPIPWPDTKPEIERLIVRMTLASAQREGLDLYGLTRDPTQNEERHFDFSLRTRDGDQYLDVMEIRYGDRDHHLVPGGYVVGDLADAVWANIRKKSESYRGNAGLRVHLLIYPTDWRFRPSDGVLRLLGYWSAHREHCFSSIVCFAPVDTQGGEVSIIYPSASDEFVDFDEEATRDVAVLNANPGAVAFVSPGAGEMPLVPPTVVPPHAESSAQPSAPTSSATDRTVVYHASIEVPLSVFLSKPDRNRR